MWKKILLTLIVLVLVISALGAFKFLQISAAIKQASSFQPPPEAVTTVTVQEDSWKPTLNAVGSTESVNGVVLSADLAGVVEEIAFESGRAAKAGDLLVQLNVEQEKAVLKSAEARRQLAQLNLQRVQSLLGKRVSAQSEYDQAAAEFQQASAVVDETKAIIERKTIRAPFDGVLGIRMVNKGQYLQSGDPIVPLQSTESLYVNFNLPQQDLTSLKAGNPVRVIVPGKSDLVFDGKIHAIDSLVDAETRNIKVQALVDNAEGKLRAGMFTRVEVILPLEEKILAVPSTAISYAPYGDSVYVIEEMKDPQGNTYLGARQQFVKLGPARGDLITVASGLKPGDQVATAGVFKLRNGAAVTINNSIQPQAELNPTPEDT